MTEDIAALREKALAATPGPWASRRAAHPTDGAYDFAIGASVDGRQQCIAEAFGRSGEASFPPAEANAAFIAAANPTAILALLDRLETAEQEARDARARVAALEAALRLASSAGDPGRGRTCNLPVARAPRFVRIAEVSPNYARIVLVSCTTRGTWVDNPRSRGRVVPVTAFIGRRRRYDFWEAASGAALREAAG